MTLNDEQKLEVLLAALEERYQAMRTIRERVESVGLWVLGLFAGVGGWLLQSEIELSGVDKAISIIGLCVAFVALRFSYLADLQNGFAGQQRVAVTIEDTLGLFDPGALGPAERSIYPSSWREAGRLEGKGRFFASTYGLLYVGAGFLAAVLISG